MEQEEEALQPPSEEQLTEETQVNEHRAEVKEPAKYVESTRVEAYNDEFDLKTKFWRYRNDQERLREAVQHQAEEWNEEPLDIVLDAVVKEVLYRELRRPGRRLTLIISEEGKAEVRILL